MKKILNQAVIFIYMLLLGMMQSYAQQGVAINASVAAANTFAMLDISSPGKGILVPRM